MRYFIPLLFFRYVYLNKQALSISLLGILYHTYLLG